MDTLFEVRQMLIDEERNGQALEKKHSVLEDFLDSTNAKSTAGVGRTVAVENESL